jgi:hypothetical protein
MLVNQDGICALKTLATASTHAYSGVSIGWDGGCELRLVATGLACY